MKFGKNQMVIINFDKKKRRRRRGHSHNNNNNNNNQRKEKKRKKFLTQRNEMKIILFQVVHRLDGDGDRDGGEVDDDDGVGR